MRRITFMLMVACFLSGITSADAGSRVEEQWTLPLSGNSGQELMGLLIQDDAQQPASVLIGNITGSPDQLDQRICTGTGDTRCSIGSERFDAVIEPCSSSSEVNCIVGIEVFDTEEKVTQGIYANVRIPSQATNAFAADPSVNLPKGGTPSVWTFPGLNGPSSYLASVRLRGNRSAGAAFTFSDYSLRLSPFSLITGTYSPPRYLEGDQRDLPECAGKKNACGIALQGQSPTQCAAVDFGVCALREAFPPNTRFRFTLRISQSPTGWFHGRVKDPNVQIEREGNNYLVSISGAPVTVPVVGILMSRNQLTSEVINMSLDGNYQWGEPGPNGLRNRLAKPAPDQRAAVDLYRLWQPYINDKASASPTIWSFRSMQVNDASNRCFRDSSKLLGVVTTNSAIYSPGPPEFDAATGSLNYKVLSPHFNSDETTFLGTYNLQIRSEVARCVYGFSSAPIKATVSVISDSGEQRIATIATSERDGWLRLAAYGFTFSEPTIRVVLSQAPLTVSKSNTAKSITCVKGKQIKQFAKTTCPRGWKKR